MIVVATTEKDDETQSEEPAASSEDDQDTEDTSQTPDIEVDSVEHAEAESADDDEDNTLLAGKREKAARPSSSWVQYLRRGAMPLLLAGALALSAFLGWPAMAAAPGEAGGPAGSTGRHRLRPSADQH
ncbi:hypothetical protein MSHO_61400 [Mycobacterium shottsii]|uniref:Uncharacterized protein n=1 Tax=Mycobacterium shottsii TaxID=133549 RepID=A0A7I7LLQ3_9MYCO|nr:hypothetical protein MSHO_61400 [Mycobacterium shottsii]